MPGLVRDRVRIELAASPGLTREAVVRRPHSSTI